MLLRHEMDLNESWRRVDLITLGNELTGYEIKSAADTLARLPGQAAYGKVLEKTTLVVSSHHISKATELLPPWWGIIEADHNLAEVTLRRVRETQPNPALDPFFLIRLLWKSEVVRELRKRSMMRPRLSTALKWDLCELLRQQVQLPELRDLVRDTLRARLLKQDTPTLFQHGRWG